MQIAGFSPSPEGSDDLEPRTLLREDRARVSGPGLRAFGNIADQFGLSEAERKTLLGDPPRSTYHQWMPKARDIDPLRCHPIRSYGSLPSLVSTRPCTSLFEDQDQAMVWLKGPHKSTLFAGASPMTCMLDGGLDSFMSVRRYLDAWCAGHSGAAASEGKIEPVTEDDLA